MIPREVANARAEQYLNRLEVCLRGVAAPEKEDILQEIQAHILDATAAASDPGAATERVLRLLGTPEELAGRYSTENLLIRASRSFSPWRLLGTSWRWAKLGMKGMIAFLVALFGYVTAFAMTVSVVLKPFMPDRVGLWIGSEGLDIGMPSHPERMHELLGRSFIPVIAAAAFALAVGTTFLLRWMMSKPNARRVYLASGTRLSKPAEI